MFKRAIACCSIVLGSSACSAVSDGQTDTGEEEAKLLSQSEALSLAFGQPSLPPDTSNVQEIETVGFAFCSFTIGTAEQAPPFPPQRLVWLRRQANSGRPCPGGYVILGSSYGFPVVDLERHPFLPALVASFTVKATPSGAAHSQLRVVQPSYLTGAVLHQTGLAAMAPSSSQPFLGNILSGDLNLEFNGTLVVSGEKNGLITSSESPPGDPNYVATYDFFLFDPDPQPIADDITTF
jgi:hypothetical protein